MKNDLISVVIPVFNVELYLKRCLDSVINQTYRNLEIILIDDGSLDGSGKICDEYKEKDNRIKVIHQENGGLSDARNKGIEIATGKYITFIDSDDYVEDDYVEYLYNLICKYTTNISMCKHTVFYDDRVKNNRKKTNYDKLLTKEEVFTDILYAKNFEVSAWGKMYLTKQFKDVRYPVGKIFEDNMTTYKLIDKNLNIACGYLSKYNYMIRKNSITKKEFSKSQLYLIDSVDDMCSYLLKYHQLEKAIYRKKYWARISTLNRMLNSSNRNKSLEKQLRKEILNYRKVVIDKESSFRDKLSYICLNFGIRFYRLSWIIYEKITWRV